MEPDGRNDADPVFRRYLDRPRKGRLAQVVEAYYRFVWDTAIRVTGNAADAADITQDVFLKLLLHPPRQDEVQSPHGFLAWEVVGRAANLHRATKRRKVREQAAGRRAAEDGLPEGSLTIGVGSGSGLESDEADVDLAPGREAELVLHPRPRRD